MVQRGGRRRRIPRRGIGRRNNLRNRNTTKQNFTGTLGRISRIPRISQDAPWNQVIVQRSVEVQDNTSFSVTIQYLIDILRNQLGLPTTIGLTFRIMSIDVFDVSGRPFEMKIFNYLNEVSQQNGTLSLVTAVAWPGRVQYSSAGFRWPKTISSLPVNTTTPGTRIVASGAVGRPMGVESVGAGTLLFRVRYLWRPTQAQTVPTFNVVLSENTISKRDESDGLEVGDALPPSLEQDHLHAAPGALQRMEQLSF